MGATGRLTARFAAAVLPVFSHAIPAGPVARTGAAGSFGRLAARFAAKLRSRSPPTSHPPVRWPGQAQRVLPAALPLGSRRLCFRISPTSHLPALPARAGVSGATGRLTARFAAAVSFRISPTSHLPALPARAGVSGATGRLTARFAAAVLPVSSHVTPAGVAGPAKKRCFSFADVIYIILMENQTWRCDEKESTGFDSPGREWRPPAVSRQRVQTGKFTLEHLG